MKRIVGIDVGIVNLGMSLISIDNDTWGLKHFHVEWCENVDLTVECVLTDCPLYHSKTLSDRLDHVFQRLEPIFAQADIVVIERQPPMGHVAVEQLCFKQFRNKAVLVHPCSMHAYFSWGHDYDRRKERSIALASRFGVLPTEGRIHDIADSVCLIRYHVMSQREGVMRQRLIDRSDVMTSINAFDWNRFSLSSSTHPPPLE